MIKRITEMHKNDVFFIKKSMAYLHGYKLRLVCSALITLFNLVLDIVQPIVWGYMIANICQYEFDKVQYYILLILIIYILQSGTSYLRDYSLIYISENIERNIKVEIYEKLIDSSISVVDNMGEGDLLSRLEGDVGSVSGLFTSQLFNAAISIIKVSIISIVVVKVNWIIAVVVITVFPITYIVMRVFGAKIRNAEGVLRISVDRYYSFVQETINNIREIKTLDVKDEHRVLFDNIITRNKNLQITLGKISALQNNITIIFDFASQVIIYIVGIKLIIVGDLRVELFIAVAVYAEMMANSLLEVVEIYPGLQESMVSLERIYVLIDEIENKREEFGDKHIDRIESIEFNSVAFKYPNTNDGVYNIGFEIYSPGEYMIVGESGSGKSTITMLLIKLFKCDGGRIKINGININEIDEKSMRKCVTVISQEPKLFNMTVLDNLILGKKIDIAEVRKTCMAVGIDDYIQTLEKGYYTQVCNFGDEFSVGQKQKLAIARALLRGFGGEATKLRFFVFYVKMLCLILLTGRFCLD